MKTVSVAALRRFSYQQQTYRRGDLVPMRAVDAAIHARRGDVSLAHQYRPQVLQAEAAEPSLRRRKGRKTADDVLTYQRQDLVPEASE
jgi:hypothetical protein